VAEKLDHWVNGASYPPASSEYVPITSPADGTVVRAVAWGNAKDVNAAAGAAAQAKERWRHLPALDRGRLLVDLARAIRSSADLLAGLETSETGKPALVALTEIENSANYFEFYGGLCGLPVGETLDVRPDHHVFTRREPFGVVGVITPWNVPLNQAARACAPALAAGNAIVIKPAETTPSTTVALARLATQVGLPDGTLNVVLGGGREVGEAVVQHRDIRKVAFTGSVQTGRLIGRLAAERIIPVTLELGGKSANIIFADADVEAAVPAAVRAFTANAGQVCSAGTRLLVHRSVHDQVIAALVTEVQKIRVGRDLGPLITRDQFARVQSYFDVARGEGAWSATGGSIASQVEGSAGCYVEPTVYSNVDNSMRIAREEIFGPVLVVIPFDTDDEAVAIANDSDFGLVAGLWTRDVTRALTVSQQLEAGQVFVNTWTTGAVQTPFGGFKNSGYGREKGIEALHHYSQVKCVTIALEPQ
jgi:aldehyde dehydrogenase (NAD+)